MTTLEIEIAMMQLFPPRQNIVVPNVSWGMNLLSQHGYVSLHECDILILSKGNYATEIEIKISKSDLLADKKKAHGHYHEHIARLYFAVPDTLVDVAVDAIPERAGLYSVKAGKIPKLIRQCKRNKNCSRWTEKDRLKLAHLGTMRILGLKKKNIEGC